MELEEEQKQILIEGVNRSISGLNLDILYYTDREPENKKKIFKLKVLRKFYKNLLEKVENNNFKISDIEFE